ncbi:hypothetical protein PT974_08532 [Cladobotryum mycophilum]|uniref:DUF3074 domain-containing protein n=1 Tax=Cladobotryum mycophilum TaxID=491253 RepID=A0ABR0SDN4_9HYPO
MGSHHEPFLALGPIDWDDVPVDSLKPFLDGIFADAQTVIESIPSPTIISAVTGRARSQTDSAVLVADIQKIHSQRQSGASLATAQQLRKEWKEVKVNVNPMGISVYKLAAKDGKGSWFARRSVHEGLTFDSWKTGLEKEFPETMKFQSGPGSGNIRGIGADKRVESQLIDGSGHLSVFQLSAQFPGPTAPRDFITLLLTSDNSQQHNGNSRPLRQYVIVSKPCTHPECPNRQGIIRGQYESVEIIREVPIERDPLVTGRSLSSTDLSTDESRRTGAESGQAQMTAIEWLMVTRSDPGGSVPRFMVEKGTPPGIVGDAGKFVNWITEKSKDNFATSDDANPQTDAATGNDGQNNIQKIPSIREPDSAQQQEGQDENIPSSNGIYGIISGIYGVASSVVASGFRQFSSPAGSNASQESLHEMTEGLEDDDDDDQTVSSETSSIRTFASALEKSLTEEQRAQSLAGSNSDESKAQNQSLERELRKLQERRRKLDEKAIQMQERLESKPKMREKHEKELAKQEAKYKRELQKLEEKREQEERKAEARRRKNVEKEEKLTLSLELEKARAERDVALKQIEILKSQVGELQAQNTMLVAKMGRLGGIDRTNSSDSKGSGVASTKSG